MESETTSLNDLPEEVLLKIFSHFGPEDLCLILAKVCGRWKGLTESVILWKELSCSCDDLSDISRIKEGLSGNTVRLIADSCQQLKKLILKGAAEVLDDDDVIHVINRLGKQLTTLVLNGESLTDAAYSYLKNCSRLQELGLCWCDKMTDRGLLEGIGSLHELTSLRLTEGHNLTAQALSTFLHRPSMTSIVLLNLSECSNLDDEGLKGIAERCVHLNKLRICGCYNVTDAGISMVISHCSQLRVLDLADLLSITGAGWVALVPSHLPQLRELCLVQCDNVCLKLLEELKAAAPELKVRIYLGDTVRAMREKTPGNYL